MTVSGPTTFVSLASWQRSYISWIGQFAPALLSCGLLNPATQEQLFSKRVESCGRCLQDLLCPTDLIETETGCSTKSP